MKFSWKIFFTSFIIITLSFGIGGFVLINSQFVTSLDNKIQAACDNNGFITASLYAVVYNSDATTSANPPYTDYLISNFTKQVASNDNSTSVKIGKATDMSFYSKSSYINELDVNKRGWQIVDNDGKSYLQTVSKINIVDRDMYIETLTDITDLYVSRNNICQMYQLILICVTLLASIVLFAVSRFITAPLVKLSNVSKQIAHGDFSQRVDTTKKSMQTNEINQVAENFNTMASCVENYIEQLKLDAQQRDDFVANFTHELKTPLTSVIGYADMLRSYELDATKRRKCADYIYKEGKRLESLSVNLLNIIVMKNSEISLQKIKTSVFFAEIENIVKFLLKKYNIHLVVEKEDAVILAEPSMFSTLMYNLIDNACKASKSDDEITIYGYIKNNRYYITVQDYGTGIPKDELKKIIHPFYMVDKSRSRHLGGAGLGLPLCSEIAQLHGSNLEFESEVNKGTMVTFSVAMENSEIINTNKMAVKKLEEES